MSQDRKELSKALRYFLRCCLFDANKPIELVLTYADHETPEVLNELKSLTVIELLSGCCEIHLEICKEFSETPVKPTDTMFRPSEDSHSAFYYPVPRKPSD